MPGRADESAGKPAPKAERIPLDVIYEDRDVLVVNKPAGMVVHPAPGHERGTLVNAALAHAPEIARVGSAERPGIVHRLDQDTSGAIVLAKSRRAYVALRKAFETHGGVEKTYVGVTHGAPKPAKGTVETNLVKRGSRMEVAEGDGLRAVTHWEVLGRHGGLALVEFRIDTGRMHQIRVHAAYLGHPLAGDPIYGDSAADLRLRRRPTRTLLHAVRLKFVHPATGERMEFLAPPPPDIVWN